jgi:hypothetical protein
LIEDSPDNWRIKWVGNAFSFHMITDMKSDLEMPFALDVDDLNSKDWQNIENPWHYWVRDEGDA